MRRTRPNIETEYADHVSREPGPVPIFPFGEFPEKPANGFWLADEEMAILYRGLSSWGTKIQLSLSGYEHRGTSTNAAVRNVGEQITLSCEPDESLSDWARIVLYEGSTPVHTWTPKDAGSGAMRYSHTLGKGSVTRAFTALVFNSAGDPVTTSQLIAVIVTGR